MNLAPDDKTGRRSQLPGTRQHTTAARALAEKSADTHPLPLRKHLDAIFVLESARLAGLEAGEADSNYGVIGMERWSGLSPRSMRLAWSASRRYQSLGSAPAITIQGNKGALDGQFIWSGGQFEHGGAFVHFIKHRAVDHRAAGGDRIIGLAPVESPANARNLVERPRIEVVPGEPREDHRHILDIVARRYRRDRGQSGSL